MKKAYSTYIFDIDGTLIHTAPRILSSIQESLDAVGVQYERSQITNTLIGAKDTDLICVSGDLGAAYMGLQLLEREKAVYYGQIDDMNRRIKAAKAAGDDALLSKLQKQAQELNDFQPDFSGKEYLLQRQLSPEARGDIREKLLVL